MTAMAMMFLISSCARTLVNSSQTPANVNFSAKERAEAMADKKAIDYCAKFGHKGYEKVSMSSTRKAISSGNVRCETVPVKCPELFTKDGSNGLTYKYFGVARADAFKTNVNPSDRIIIPFKMNAQAK